MKKIAIVFGGNTLESEISILTSDKVKKEFILQGWKFIYIYLDHDGKFYLVNKNVPLDKMKINNFNKGSFKRIGAKNVFITPLNLHYFDMVLILSHGKGIEDGELSSFFNVLKIPVGSNSLFSSLITQNKGLFKQFLLHNHILTPKFRLIKIDDYFLFKEKYDKSLLKLKFPLICKPVSLGSSIGVKKINNISEIEEKMALVGKYEDTCIIEEFIENKEEINIALCGYKDNIIFSSFEIISLNDDVLSFSNKYDDKNRIKKVISQNIDKMIEDEIYRTSAFIFKKLDLCGICRFDFIFDKKEQKLYLNEINTIPGSLAYYLFENKGIDFSFILEKMVASYEENLFQKNKFITKFKEGFAIKNKDIGLKK